MSDLKTRRTDASVEAFLDGVENESRRKDCDRIMALMGEITGEPAKMWGTSMVGFGSYHYTYASGREGDWFVCGFSPRKQALTLYIMAGFSKYDDLMSRLGNYKTGKSCLYIKSLDDVDLTVLRQLVEASVAYINETYPPASDG